MTTIKSWKQFKKLINLLVEKKSLNEEYLSRIKYEIAEIEKQSASEIWIRRFNNKFKYETNENGLVIPWLLGMTNVDPLMSDHKIIPNSDWPDIDFDCLPEARDPIKKYAAKKYGEGRVCSVGIWQTYKFKSAMQDAARGLDEDWREAQKLTVTLPDDVDDLKDGGASSCVGCKHIHKEVLCPECGHTDTDSVTIGKLLQEYEALSNYNNKYPHVVEMAVKLVGKIKSMGRHAGGLIISNVDLKGNVPMALAGKAGSKQWTSMWSEGRSTQLSKLGYIKWDVLGLKTLQYVHDACKLIEKNRGYKFNAIPWDNNDPDINCLGYYKDPNGDEHIVPMDDPEVFEMLNERKTETVFQFETDVQMGILANGVRNYYDLQVFNAMGHPGPIACIPDYVARRDDNEEHWKEDEHPLIADMLADTKGIIVFQEQLQLLWQKFAAFTSPEAEKARKAVAKKRTEQLEYIEKKWIEGATPELGKKWAEVMWEKMKSFGRYAFNKCLSKDTILEDPTNNNTITIEELSLTNNIDFQLLSLNNDNEFVNDKVKSIIDCGEQEIFEIEFDNGTIQEVTLNHRFKCEDGKYRTVKEITEGDYSIVVQ